MSCWSSTRPASTTTATGWRPRARDGGGPRRSLGRHRDARAAGAGGPRPGGAAAARAVRVHPCRGVRRRGDRRPHRLHRRAGRRAHRGRRRGGRAVGQARRRRARPRPGSARATPCASRCATRSTATTSRRATPPSRRAWAGCARSTARSSSARRRAARPARAGGHDRLVAFRDDRPRDPAPGHGRAARRRGHERDDVAVARGRDRDGATSPPTSPRRAPRSRSTCAAGPLPRASPSKPLYVKEKVT